jgi:hypothetical protein
MTWRDVIKVHPAADLFPMMSDAELDSLGADIKKMGRLTSPIVFLIAPEGEDHFLLDGRNRLEAAERVGYEVKDRETSYWKSAHIDPYAFVVSANIQRRHLTADQKRELIGNLLKANPGKSDRQIAKTVKASPTTVGTIRKELSKLDSCEQTETRTGRDGKTRKIPVKKAKAETKLVASIKQSLREGDREARKAEVYGAKAASLMAKLDDVQASAEARKREAEIEADEVIAAIELRAALDEIGPAITDQVDTDANLFWCHFSESPCFKMWEAGTPAHRSAFLKMLTRDARDRKAAAEHADDDDDDGGPDETDAERVEREARGAAASKAMAEAWLRDHPGNSIPEHACGLRGEEAAHYDEWMSKWVSEYYAAPTGANSLTGDIGPEAVPLQPSVEAVEPISNDYPEMPTFLER